MVNNSVLVDLLKKYDQKQIQANFDAENRKKELYNKVPRLQEIEDELNSCAIKSAKSILASNNFIRIKKVYQNEQSILIHFFYFYSTYRTNPFKYSPSG